MVRPVLEFRLAELVATIAGRLDWLNAAPPGPALPGVNHVTPFESVPWLLKPDESAAKVPEPSSNFQNPTMPPSTSLRTIATSWIVSKSEAPWLSGTRTVTVFVPCEGGVQVNTPLLAPMAAPAGAPGSSEKVSVCAGRSPSVAVAVKL